MTLMDIDNALAEIDGMLDDMPSLELMIYSVLVKQQAVLTELVRERREIRQGLRETARV